MSCIACCSNNLEKAHISVDDDYSMAGFQSLFCVDCGTYFIDPRPTSNEITQYYENMNQTDDHFVEASLNYYRNPARAAARKKDYLDPILKIASSGKLLDYGAASGWFVKLASDAGFDSYGIELMPRLVEIGNRDLAPINLVQGSEEDIPNVPTYDIIVANNTIEHLIDPEIFINNCSMALNDAGLVCYTFPDGDSFMHDYLREFSYYNMPPYHLTHFTENGISKLLDRCGFEVEVFHQHDEAFYFGHGLAHKMGIKEKYKEWRKDPDFVSFDIAIDRAVAEISKKAGRALNKTVIARKKPV